MKQHTTLPTKAFTICKENSYSRTFSDKLYRTEKAAQKAADKKQDGWKVQPLFVGYERDIKDVSIEQAQGCLKDALKDLSDSSVVIEQFCSELYEEHNTIRFQPLGEARMNIKGDRSMVVDLHIKYKVDV